MRLQGAKVPRRAPKNACSGRLGFAFFGLFLGFGTPLRGSPVAKPFSPQPPVTQSVGLLIGEKYAHYIDFDDCPFYSWLHFYSCSASNYSKQRSAYNSRSLPHLYNGWACAPFDGESCNCICSSNSLSHSSSNSSTNRNINTHADTHPCATPSFPPGAVVALFA